MSLRRLIALVSDATTPAEAYKIARSHGYEVAAGMLAAKLLTTDEKRQTIRTFIRRSLPTVTPKQAFTIMAGPPDAVLRAINNCTKNVDIGLILERDIRSATNDLYANGDALLIQTGVAIYNMGGPT